MYLDFPFADKFSSHEWCAKETQFIGNSQPAETAHGTHIYSDYSSLALSEYGSEKLVERNITFRLNQLGINYTERNKVLNMCARMGYIETERATEQWFIVYMKNIHCVGYGMDTLLMYSMDSYVQRFSLHRNLLLFIQRSFAFYAIDIHVEVVWYAMLQGYRE